MSEKKEFKTLDVGATERVDWKTAQGLSKYMHFDKDGNATFGKNLEIDGAVFTLNNKEFGIMPVRLFYGDEIREEGFIFSDWLPTLDINRNILYVSGIWLNLGNDQSGICPILCDFKPNSSNTNIVNGVLFIGEEDKETFTSFFKPFATSQA